MKEKFQSLFDEPSVDVWKVDAESRLDIRMSWELYEKLGWEECSVLHESVEQLVVNFEKQLLNQTNAEWFEAYVSLEVYVYISILLVAAFSFSLCSIAMTRLLIGTKIWQKTIPVL